MKRLVPLLAWTLTGCQINTDALPEVLPVLAKVAAEVAVAMLELEDSELGGRVALPEVEARPTEGPVPEAGIVTRNESMGPVRVEYHQLPEGRWDLWVVNTHKYDISTAFSLELDGYDADKHVKTTFVPRQGRVEVAKLRQVGGRAARWTCRIQYTVGRLDAVHDDVVYLLPFGEGEPHTVGQTYFGTYSHQGRHALDFNMPEGTALRAARAGVVCDVVEKFDEGGPDESFRAKGNVIRILHDDGTIASYAHLRKDGALVDEGEPVKAGQLIGRSGNTGFSSGPHLHFEISAPVEIGTNKRKSFPTRFETSRGTLPGLGFKVGDRFTAI